MLQKIESHILISVKENGSLVDLSKSKSILFGIKQQYGKYMEFRGELVDGKILVKIPYKDAMNLTTSPTKCQLYWTDENGNKKATSSAPLPIEELLREAGYD